MGTVHSRQQFVPVGDKTAQELFIEQLHVGWPTLFVPCGDRNLVSEMYDCADPFLARLRVREVKRACLDTTKMVSFVWGDEPQQPEYDAACWYPECVGVAATKFEVRKPRPVRVGCSTKEFDLRTAAEDFCTADPLTIDGKPIPALWQWLVMQLLPSLQRKVSHGIYNGIPALGTGDENSMASLDYWIEHAPLDVTTNEPVNFLRGSVMDWAQLTEMACPGPCDVAVSTTYACDDDLNQNLLWMIRKWWTVTKYRLAARFGTPRLGDVYLMTTKPIMEALIKCAVCEAFCVDNAMEWLSRTEAVDMYKRLKQEGPFDGLLPLDLSEDDVIPVMVNDYLTQTACASGGQCAPIYLVTERLGTNIHNLNLEYRSQAEYQKIAALLGITSKLGVAPLAITDVLKGFMEASIPSDGNKWRTIMERRGDCGKVATVGEFGLTIEAPWALGRIDGVCALGMPALTCYNIWEYANDPDCSGAFGCGEGSAPTASEGEQAECTDCPPESLLVLYNGEHVDPSWFVTDTDLSGYEDEEILGRPLTVISGNNAECIGIVADIQVTNGDTILLLDDDCDSTWADNDEACLGLGACPEEPVPDPKEPYQV